MLSRSCSLRAILPAPWLLVFYSLLMLTLARGIDGDVSLYQQRERDLLEASWWRIEEPEVTIDDSELTLKWRVSDYIQDRLAGFRIYDGMDCKEGSNDITDYINDYVNGNGAVMFDTLGLQPDSNTPYDPTAQGYRDFRLFLGISGGIGEAATDQTAPGLLRYETRNSQSIAIINFCVRFQLFTDDFDDANSVEVNFQETVIVIFVDLTDGFEIEGIDVASRERLIRTANLACEINANICDPITLEPIDYTTVVFNQGTVYTVCVQLAQESKDMGLYLDRIYWFYWIMYDERFSGGSVRQNSIIFDSQEAPGGLTIYNCLRGIDVCSFDTLLKADFYIAPGVNVIDGIGEGVCRFGGSTWLVEDVEREVGEFLGWVHQDPVTDLVDSVNVTGLPVGTTIKWTDANGQLVTEDITTNDYNWYLALETEDEIRGVLNTIRLLAPLHSDDNMFARTTVNMKGGYNHFYMTEIVVYAVADPPTIEALSAVSIVEDGPSIPLGINPGMSPDDDNSEYLSLIITIPLDRDDGERVGYMEEVSSNPNVQMVVNGIKENIFVITTTTTGDSPEDREAILDDYMANDCFFKVRDNWAGSNYQISVVARSTEQNDVAPSNSILYGTAGDLNCRIEDAETFVDLLVLPVVDLPYQKKSLTIVQENKKNSDQDVDLVVKIGEEISLAVDDLDGSQTMTAEISNFPLNLQDISVKVYRAGVDVRIFRDTGIVTVNGPDVADILAVMNSIEITLANDDDTNFQLIINGTCTDTNGIDTVIEDYFITHQVIVQAVVDSPTLDVGLRTKALISENEPPIQYPVEVAINDVDGSESFKDNQITIQLTTSTEIATGAEPIVSFVDSTNVQVDQENSEVTLTGSYSDIEAAMTGLTIRPGSQNGEDILVEIFVTAAESNPTEAGSGEIFREFKNVIDSFTIPIDPVIEGYPVLETPTQPVSGNEDTKIPLGTFTVRLEGILDADGSEIYHLEIKKDSFPDKTFFWIDGEKQLGTILDGWVQFPGGINGKISEVVLEPPPNFSGPITLVSRGHVIDQTMTGNAELTTENQDFVVNVMPVADDIKRPPGKTWAIEDLEPATVGVTLRKKGGFTLTDNGTGPGNNADSETIYQVEIEVPADTEDMEYTVFFEESTTSADVTLDQSSRTYIITSSIITGSSDLVSIPIAQREQAQVDILKLMKTLTVKIGPEHNAEDGRIKLKVSIADVNLGIASTKVITFNHNVKIRAVADTPSIFVHEETETIAEDSDDIIPLKINVTRSSDRDDSEVLSVRLTVPQDGSGPIGTIVGTPPVDVTLNPQGNGVYMINSVGDDPLIRENKLNSFLNSSASALAFQPRENWAGNDMIKVEAISTEQYNGGQIAQDQYGGDDNDSKTETVNAFIPVSVVPVADQPEVTIAAAAAGLEDTKIEVPVRVTLKDMDGSETYTMEITNNIPEGTKLFVNNAEISPSSESGPYLLEPQDIFTLRIQPPLHWSSAIASQGDIVLQTKTIVTDTVAGFPTSIAEGFLDIPVFIQGVADLPAQRSITVTATEDQDYPIGLFVGNLDDILEDRDGSETLSLVLEGMPGGVVPKTDSAETGLTYLGGGKWQVEKTSIRDLKISPRRNYSGDNPYPNLRLRFVAQEADGDQIDVEWPITINVYPVPDGINWSPSDSAFERENEVDGRGILLSKAGTYTLKDPDSEEVLSFTFDMTNFIASALIQKRLDNILNVDNSNLEDLIAAGLLEGTYAFDPSTKNVVVQAADISGIKLNSELFLDSNVDFSLPVSALVRDTATIENQIIIRDMTQGSSFSVNLKGTADIPTVFAESVDGDRRIPISLGGESTDTDLALNRDLSESIYYIVQLLEDGGDLPCYGFINAGGGSIGFSGGGRTWLFRKEELDANVGNLYWNACLRGIAVSDDDGSRRLESDPTDAPSLSSAPSDAPSDGPSASYFPSSDPTDAPSLSSAPSDAPSDGPSLSSAPSDAPSDGPSASYYPSSDPTDAPSLSSAPSDAPSDKPSASYYPSSVPSGSPSLTPYAPAQFKFTSIATDDDSRASNSTTFNVDYYLGPGTEPLCRPLVPDLSFGDNNGKEDEKLPLAINAQPAVGEVCDPVVSVVFHSIPVGFKLQGAALLLNTVTGNYVVEANRILAGDVKLSPKKHYSGTGEVVVEAIAANRFFDDVSTGLVSFPVFFDPVADRLAIGVGNTGGAENTELDFPVSVQLVDNDSSEVVEDYIYIKVCNELTLNGNYPTVSGTDAQLDDDTNVDGYFKIPTAESSTLTMQPLEYWHGACSIKIRAVSLEIDDDDDGDNRRVTNKDVTVNIAAVGTPPIILGPSLIQGNEDAEIPIVGLEVNRVDNNEANGFETLSLIVSGVPDNSIFRPGSNSGSDGITASWTIPVDQLSTLTFEAPENYAGEFTLVFTAFAREKSNGAVGSSSLEIPVVIDPVADAFQLVVPNKYNLVQNVQSVPLGDNVVIGADRNGAGTRGNLPGEVPPEILEITFAGVPTGVSFSPGDSGGTIQNMNGGQWLFTGTQDEANSILVNVGANAAVGKTFLTASGVSRDGTSINYSDPQLDTFEIEIVPPDDTTRRRELDETSNTIRSLQGSSDENARGVRNCASDITIVKNNAAYPLPSGMFLIDNQNDETVGYRVKHAFASGIQWLSFLHAESPVGMTQCLSEVYSADDEISIIGNCDDFVSRVYLYLNVKQSNEDELSGNQPTVECTLPDDAPSGGVTYVYEVLVPCSACAVAQSARRSLSAALPAGTTDRTGDQPSRSETVEEQLPYFTDPRFQPMPSSSGRRLQQINQNDAAEETVAQFEMEVTLVGDDSKDGSSGHRRFPATVVSLVGLATAATTLLFF